MPGEWLLAAPLDGELIGGPLGHYPCCGGRQLAVVRSRAANPPERGRSWRNNLCSRARSAIQHSQSAPVRCDRVMFADEQLVPLATSYLPRDVTRGSRIEDKDTGLGGTYARIKDADHILVHFIEQIRIGPATRYGADQLTITTGASVYRIQRTAHTSHRPVETNLITAAVDRFELRYELPAG